MVSMACQADPLKKAALRQLADATDFGKLA
jgi:hypothetical protein